MSRILLVDDDEDMLAMVERWLTKEGYEVVKAVSGPAALEALSASIPDLVLLDYMMPGMDGPAVLKEIRANEEWTNIPVLYRTGMEDTELGAGGGEARPDGIAPKSGGKPGLMKAIEAVL